MQKPGSAKTAPGKLLLSKKRLPDVAKGEGWFLFLLTLFKRNHIFQRLLVKFYAIAVKRNADVGIDFFL